MFAISAIGLIAGPAVPAQNGEGPGFPRPSSVERRSCVYGVFTRTIVGFGIPAAPP